MFLIHRRRFLLGLAALGVPATATYVEAQKDKGKGKGPDPDQADEDGARHLTELSKKAKYPIKSFDDLATQLGGKGASFKFGGATTKVGDLQKHIPADTFPITSEDDMHHKASRLRTRIPPGKGKGKKMAAAPAKAPKRPTAKDPPKPKGTGRGVGVKKK